MNPQASALDKFLDQYPIENEDGILIFRAVPGDYLRRLRGRPVFCQQTFKPEADALVGLGAEAVTETDTQCSLAIVFATKHKEETLYHIAQAVSRLHEGGRLVVTAANDLGATSLEKRCAELIGRIQSFSKHKCRVFWGKKESARLDRVLMASWLRAGELQPIPGTDLLSRPGVFSWNRIDPGSRLLVECLPDDLAGCGADLGAGYGYLSRMLLSRSAAITGLHLFEAEHKALEAARRNLAVFAPLTSLHFHWHDVTAGLPVDQFDFVIMNPPFHTGREADPGLGRAFIRTALTSLKPDGRLYFVANRHLPYEKLVRTCAGREKTLAECGGYKVMEVRKQWEAGRYGRCQRQAPEAALDATANSPDPHPAENKAPSEAPSERRRSSDTLLQVE
ncbi:class I SAM-dependent methyltransferase [Methylocaldum szegediense]|uniref:16S rRNA (Guanine1207-N2)-methyltransferase n=1 Tax=Methylocaldum szegediense TaxID=73780 RepID=A0ABM9I833_9GAMM|nr:class I SAM-dependent methyltransferase [Methylocaldum szegediense]CAI8949287.1 16S rRNA (guanine1207-N2)-methyltransferase [Methylocaldum szegediense]